MDHRITFSARRSAGFTLIELLVVMLIVAMIASVVVLNMPPPRDSQKNQAEVFAARLNLAAEMAIMTGSMIGLEVDPSGYRYYRFVDGAWAAHDDKQLQPTTFAADMAVEFTVTDQSLKNEMLDTKRTDDKDDTPSPVVFIAPTGETTPMAAQFVSQRRVLTVDLDAAGNVTLATP